MNVIISKINKMNKKQMAFIIIAIYIINIIFRTFFALKTKTAIIEPDELIYLDIAESFWHTGKMTVHNQPLNLQQFLYGLIISPLMGIENLSFRYQMIALVNSILITSSIFPTYCIAKKMINQNSLIILCILFTMLLPDMAMSMSFMAENLFFPLCLWTIYVLICFWYEKTDNLKKKKYIVILAILCAVCYYTKIISLYITVGFITGLFLNIFLFKEENIKKNLSYLFWYLAFFLVLKFGIKEIFYYHILGAVDNYSIISLTNINSGYKFIYFVYAGIYIVMCTIIAFFYFPVLYPIFHFKKLEARDKKVFLSIVIIILFAIGVICYMISVKEDYSYIAPKVHLRYYSPFLVPLLIIYLKILFLNKNPDRNLNKTLLVGITVFLCMLIMGMLHFTRYGILDGVLLQFFLAVEKNVHYFNYEAGKLSFSIVEFAVKLFIIIVIIYPTILWYFKRQKNFMYSSIILIVSVCVLNNICAIKTFDTLYNQFYSEEKRKEIQNLRKYLDNKEGNILVITDGFNKMLETYFYHDSYYTFKADILEKLDKNNSINLKITQLNSTYPYMAYSKLDKVNYVVTDNSVVLPNENAEQITLKNLTNYSLYTIKNPNYLIVDDNSVFPTLVNTSRVLWTNGGLLYTGYDIDKNGFFISNSSKNKALCYGPYAKLTSGSYEISFYYDDMTEKLAGERLGIVELVTHYKDASNIISTADFYAKENYITLPLAVLEEDSNNTEIRMWTNIEGIRLKYIKIKKVAE